MGLACIIEGRPPSSDDRAKMGAARPRPASIDPPAKRSEGQPHGAAGAVAPLRRSSQPRRRPRIGGGAYAPLEPSPAPASSIASKQNLKKRSASNRHRCSLFCLVLLRRTRVVLSSLGVPIMATLHIRPTNQANLGGKTAAPDSRLVRWW